MGVVLLRCLGPAVVQLGHPGDGAEPLAGLPLQLLAVVGGVVGQRDGEGSGVVLLGPAGWCAVVLEKVPSEGS